MNNDMIRRQDMVEAIEQLDWYSLNKNTISQGAENEEQAFVRYTELEAAVNAVPHVNTNALPCKIGDIVWAIRSFRGACHPQQGIVSEMFFTADMRLLIVVKYVSRGEWGKTVFATYEEAVAAIKAKENPTSSKEKAGVF